MAMLTEKDFRSRHIYVYLPYQDSMVRYDYLSKKYFLKFVNPVKMEQECPYEHELVYETLFYGIEISKDEYETGKTNSENV